MNQKRSQLADVKNDNGETQKAAGLGALLKGEREKKCLSHEQVAQITRIRPHILESLENQWGLLMENIGKGDFDTFNEPVFPKGEVRGVGFHEAPRGMLSHWVVINDGKIKNYQCVVPSTWNAAPRNSEDAKGPYEAALIGNPIADPEKPLEVLRTVHSFDPCLACAIHVVDSNKKEIIKVRAF